MANKQARTRRLGTMQDIKTAVTARIRSKPSVVGQEYIDLWSLTRDRARWARARDQAEERLESIDEMIEGLDVPTQHATSEDRDVPAAARTIDFQRCTEPKRRTRRK